MSRHARLLPPLGDMNLAPPERALAQDMLYGADEIGRFVGLPVDHPDMGTRTKAIKRVSYLKRSGWPIFSLAGVGIAARRSTLVAFIAKTEKKGA